MSDHRGCGLPELHSTPGGEILASWTGNSKAIHDETYVPAAGGGWAPIRSLARRFRYRALERWADLCRQLIKERKMAHVRSTLMILAVCAAASACNPVQNKEDMLAAAGFTLVPANTPQRQASLSSLPPHKFVHQVRNNAVIFIYADPTICDCLYVGNQAAYDRYRQDVFAKNLANEQQMTAQINEAEEWGPEWTIWGY